MNRTGVGAAPERSREMQQGMDEFPPTSHGDGQAPAQVRAEYDAEGVTIGSLPETGRIGQPVDPAAATLLDKLGARLAFERVGTRLYDALLGKLTADAEFDGGPTRDDLEELRAQEHEHFLLAQRAIVRLGGDPTAITPAADVQLTAGQGVPSIVQDPRTSLVQSLEAVLVAELVDHESWETLIDLLDQHDLSDLAPEFERALATERDHLRKVRDWLAAAPA